MINDTKQTLQDASPSLARINALGKELEAIGESIDQLELTCAPILRRSVGVEAKQEPQQEWSTELEHRLLDLEAAASKTHWDLQDLIERIAL